LKTNFYRNELIAAKRKRIAIDLDGISIKQIENEMRYDCEKIESDKSLIYQICIHIKAGNLSGIEMLL
jgi:hypothetical protein